MFLPHHGDVPNVMPSCADGPVAGSIQIHVSEVVFRDRNIVGQKNPTALYVCGCFPQLEFVLRRQIRCMACLLVISIDAQDFLK